jgi:dethiobiotin synthetase
MTTMLTFPRRFFVTGTDTDVGKSVVCAVLMAGLGAAYWKPIQTGSVEGTDTDRLRRITSLPDDHFFPERYCLSAPLSPHAAADQAGVRIAIDDFCLPRTADDFPYVIVEGAGGVMVPLNERDLMTDLIAFLDLPVLLVVRSTLGTINHTLLSLAQLRGRGIPVLGVVMNGPQNPLNRKAIEHFGRVPVLAELEPLSALNPAALRRGFERCFLPNEFPPDKDRS